MKNYGDWSSWQSFVTEGIISGVDLVSDEINIYPNPASDIVNISIPALGKYELVVSDILGNIVNRTHDNNESIQLQLANYSSGVYFIHIRNMDISYKAVLIIQK